MKHSWMSGLIFWALSLLTVFTLASSSNDGPFYDSTAYTECKAEAEKPLYNGGMLRDKEPSVSGKDTLTGIGARYTPAYILHNLTQNTIYCFSIWVKIEAGSASARVRAKLRADNTTLNCVGSVSAKHGCWSFLKGGFLLDSPSKLSILFFETSDDDGTTQLQVASASLQPFTQEQWRNNQDYFINTVKIQRIKIENCVLYGVPFVTSSLFQARKRAVTIHVSEKNGESVEGAVVRVEQISKDFPIGSAISKTILGNIPYQEWFVKRFDATVFENELKWYATEPDQGRLNYTFADQMMNFVRANRIIARGHNIFWEDPKYTPNWVRNLTGEDLRSAVNRRIRSLMSRYRGEFVHWDVSNEMLHFDFYESRLGKNASNGFFAAARELDSLATLFLNDFNVVETCSDERSTVDEYIARVRELERFDGGGIRMDGVGLEGHFTTPNAALMRATLDKLATLDLPIWLTEIDISNSFDHRTQAIYLEQVLREGFSHPSVNGIMLWTALHPNGCYQMCLTDDKFRNLPAGDVVDQKLLEWNTGEVKATTDDHGSFSFLGFLGEYRVSIIYQGKTVNSSFSLSRGPETKHVRLQV